MKIFDHFVRSGNLFFRWRSCLPLVAVPLFVASFIGATYPFNSHAWDLTWEAGCFLLSVTGLTIRIYTVGTAPRGTSGRSTRRQQAEVLNTRGSYSLVRHPLYVGNYVIALGLSAFSRTWHLPFIVSLLVLLYYERIAVLEEEYLEKKFGEEFRQWAVRVPAMVPNLCDYRPPERPFSWKRALGREYYSISLVPVSFFVLEVIQDLAVTGRLQFDPLWTLLGTLSAFFFVTMRTLKKWTRLLREDRALEPKVHGN